MHILRLFFGWPDGAIWGNVWAMPVCGVIAAVFAFVFKERIGRGLRAWHRRHFGHHDQLDEIRARLDAHADLLDPHSPGGLAAVLDEVRRAVTAAESAREAVQALGVIRTAPRRGPTEMRPAAAKPAPGGTGSRVPPKGGGKT